MLEVGAMNDDKRPDFEALYTSLFNDVTDAIGFFQSIETIAGNARRRLLRVQQDAEERVNEE